jgi:hypothetical protein
MQVRWFLAFGLMAFAAPVYAASSPPQTGSVRLFVEFPMHHDNVDDIFDQNNPAHAWPTVLKNTAVMHFSQGYILRPRTPVDYIVAFLKRNHIKMSLGINVVMQGYDTTPPTRVKSETGEPVICGEHVAASGFPANAGLAIAKIQQAGGQVDFVTLDEPLYAGHEYTHNPARRGQSYGCQWTIPQVAEMVAQAVKSINAVNTNHALRYAEWEPMGTRTVSTEQKFADFQVWEPMLTKTLGQKITYMFADADMLGVSKSSLPETEALMVRLKPWLAQYGGIELVANCTGGRKTEDSAKWGEEAIESCRRAEALGITNPTIAMWGNWNQHMPAQLVPETLPGSYTNDMLRYLAIRNPSR